jgi:hypothetical protein
VEKTMEKPHPVEHRDNTEEEDDSGSCRSSCRSVENDMITENDEEDPGDEEVSCASYASYDDESPVCDDMGVLGTSSPPFDLRRKARASERSVYAGPELWYDDDADDDEWD